jgi:hypothetical protein
MPCAVALYHRDGPAAMSDDPINPAHYAGRACADIGERLTANGYQILKYCWRLGRKDKADVELGKAEWYANSEYALLTRVAAMGVQMRTAPLIFDLSNSAIFLLERIKDQPAFTQEIARLLWRGYNVYEIKAIADLITTERQRYASS